VRLINFTIYLLILASAYQRDDDLPVDGSGRLIVFFAIRATELMKRGCGPSPEGPVPA
jgi:hypothetical protein